MLRETPLEFEHLFLGQRNGLFWDAVPEVLRELNALGRTELEKIGKRVRLHNLKIPEFGAGYKRPNAGG